MRKNLLTVGEPLPWFVANCSVNPQFHFDTTAGRYNILCLFGVAGNPASRRILDDVLAIQIKDGFFDVDNFVFTGVSIDPQDAYDPLLQQADHGVRWFWDFDKAISQQLGAVPGESSADGTLISYRPQTIVLDERLRVLKIIPFLPDPETHVQRLMAYLSTLPRFDAPSTATVQAPVLVVPRIFEPELCQALISYYEQKGGVDSGFMRDANGQTVAVLDYSHKRRADCEIEDERLRQACMVRIHDRLVPEIMKAFQFNATRMERYIVACYSSATEDHFRPHRDNTTKGTAHRRFAVSLVLNTGEFEGGYLRFPEFGRQLYAPPTGGAVVFSCSLLHEATPVTSGRRFVFLPFLYDDAAAKIREQNLQFVADTGTAAKSSGNHQK
jgi:peroxiredoxin/predicted 2-oxoglutarate/Fe(II)-dependent dioxygenase YbiX